MLLSEENEAQEHYFNNSILLEIEEPRGTFWGSSSKKFLQENTFWNLVLHSELKYFHDNNN